MGGLDCRHRLRLPRSRSSKPLQMMKPLTYDQLDDLGRLSDKADNFYHAGALMPGLSAETHREALTNGMLDIRNELRRLYKEISGEDPWEE